jgi:hypothetical protein
MENKRMTDVVDRIARKSRLAELVSLDIAIADAADRMRISRNYAYALWAEIKRDLGPQAA